MEDWGDWWSLIYEIAFSLHFLADASEDAEHVADLDMMVRWVCREGLWWWGVVLSFTNIRLQIAWCIDNKMLILALTTWICWNRSHVIAVMCWINTWDKDRLFLWCACLCIACSDRDWLLPMWSPCLYIICRNEYLFYIEIACLSKVCGNESVLMTFILVRWLISFVFLLLWKRLLLSIDYFCCLRPHIWSTHFLFYFWTYYICSVLVCSHCIIFM